MSGTREQGFRFRPKLIAASVAVCFAMSAPQVLANPSGATVAAGSAGFTAAGNALTVTNSSNAIINWQGFSIGINEITRFVQPSAASAVLNRVVGANGVIPQSVIDGVLSSNGRVFLLNPMGVVIGANARIDVAGLVASSLNLSDQDFLNGKLHFTEVAGAGAVVNHGIIETASGGRVFLVAPQVENSGIIRAPQGEIVLAAGKSADLVSESSPYVSVRVVADAEQALNVGSLIADSGRIGMYGALLRNSGVAEANGATVGPGGQIQFIATKDLTIDAGSRISANGTSGGQIVLQAAGGTNLIAGTVEATGSAGQGGTVQALGVRVGVIGNGVIDASGETGGGTVLVGGDYQGKNPDIQNAERTLIGTDGVIRADARTTGDGGRVIVWADGDTQFYGSISVRGGSQSGDGGFVETSGKYSLDFRGLADTRAPMGHAGTLLLDPASGFSITHGTNAADSNIACNGGACPGAAPFSDTTAYGGVGTLSDGTINTQLTMGSVVVHTSSGDIVVGSNGVAIAPSGGSNANTLTLDSAGNVLWNGNWSYTNNGVLTLRANGTGHISGSGTLTAGDLILSAVNGIGAGREGSGLQTHVNNLQATNSGGCCSGIEISNTGNLTLRDLGDPASPGFAVRNANGGVVINATGNITVNNTVTSGRRLNLNANGDLVLNANLIANTSGTNFEVDLIADADENGTGSITSSPGFGNIFTNGGFLVAQGASVTLGGINTTRSNDAFYGGRGGGVFVQANNGSIWVNGVVDTHGADGVPGINIHGGDGGSVSLYAPVSVTVGPPATPGVNRVVINTSGGNGSGAGAYGGSAGDVFIDPQNITLNGIVQATGGTGGTGGGGGFGGNLYLFTLNGTGTVTFINGGWDLTGAAGLLSDGKATIEGTLIFVTLLTDALTNPSVAQAVGQTIQKKLGSCKAG